MAIRLNGQRVWVGGSQTGGVELIAAVDGVVYNVQVSAPPNAANDRVVESFMVQLFQASH